MTSDALTRLADALPADSDDHGPVAVASDDIRTYVDLEGGIIDSWIDLTADEQTYMRSLIKPDPARATGDTE